MLPDVAVGVVEQVAARGQTAILQDESQLAPDLAVAGLALLPAVLRMGRTSASMSSTTQSEAWSSCWAFTAGISRDPKLGEGAVENETTVTPGPWRARARGRSIRGDRLAALERLTS